MNKISLIIKREYLSRVRKKSFIIMTFLGPIIMVALMGLAIWLSLSEENNHQVLVVDETPTGFFMDAFKNTEGVQFFYQQDAIKREELNKSPYDLMLFINEQVITNEIAILHHKKLPSYRTQGYITHQLEEAIENYKLLVNEIPKEKYDAISTKIDLKSQSIQEGEEGERGQYKMELAIVGFGFAVLIYMFIFIYSTQVMRGVIEEKTNRVVEVLISTVKPFQLMMGKIIGIALVGFTQFTLWVALTAVLGGVAKGVFMDKITEAAALSQDQIAENLQVGTDGGMGITEDTAYFFNLIDRINFPLLLGMFMFFFLGGYLLYASLFAAVGAAVDNETDTQQFMLPLTAPLIFGFIVAEMALQNPEGPAVFWFSMFPLTSPVVMMIRVAMGFSGENIWELYTSMALLVVTFIGIVALAAKIYRTGILMYGKKITYKELFKWLKHKG